MKFFLRIIAAGGIVLSLVVVQNAFAASIDGTNKYAWGENIGWLNWSTSEGAVDVGATALTGYVWGENVGWISLNCSNTSSCGTVNYQVTNATGVLSGYAWGENVGWISFSCANTSTCGTVNYGVTISQTTGDFSGYAWGENTGWISLNCSNTSSCGTANYKVSEVIAVPGGGGSGGGGSTPGPSPVATGSPVPSAAPTPSATPAPSSTPVSSPSALPPAPETSPPPSEPSAPPSSGGPAESSGGGITGFVNSVSQFVDDAIQGILGVSAATTVATGAATAAAVAVVPLFAAAATILVQQETAAMASHTLIVFGLRRKPKVWGTVYDTRTKHPIPFAKLQLMESSGHVLETRFADRDGRYGFLTSPQSLRVDSLKIRIVASKDGYQFPSRTTALDNDFVVYDHLYRGGEVVVTTDTLLNFNIPMDSVSAEQRVWSAWGLGLIGSVTDRLLNLGFILGLFLVPLNAIWYPTLINFIILVVFLGANAMRIFVLYRPYGVIKDAMTGAIMPFALVTLNDLSGKRLAFAVSDERGRYFLSTERGGEYLLTISTPANVVPGRTKTEHITPHSRTSRRAWVTLNIAV